MVSESLHVAVVDDDPSVRKALLRLIRSAGYTVEGFASAEHFMRLRRRPHCLVLDVRLPGMSGVELQRVLKRNGSPTPVVFISGDGTLESRESALRHGAVDFLHKPFDHGALLAAIRQAMAFDRGGGRPGGGSAENASSGSA